jgi:hypothetical protein
VRSVLVRDFFDLRDAVSVIVAKPCVQVLDISMDKRMDQTYSDLMGLVGSVLLHETLGSRGRHVSEGVRTFSRHVVY